jgi:hypothetical protein
MKKTYYCPRGCNVFETEIEDPDCAACGQIMITDSGPFDDAHEERELRAIAEWERKLKEDRKPK